MAGAYTAWSVFGAEVFQRAIARELARPADVLRVAYVPLGIAAALAIIAIVARSRAARAGVLVGGVALAVGGTLREGATAAIIMNAIASPNERDLAFSAAKVAGSLVAGGAVVALALVLLVVTASRGKAEA
jgi:hypothetical protein